MANRTLAAFVTACLLAGPVVVSPARADNQMGYRMLSPQDASSLPRNHGAFGMEVASGRRISESGLNFEMIRITSVHRGSPGAQAGFHQGDQIIAVDGVVFASIASFASYVGSLQPGRQVNIDAIPTGGGPAQAERVSVLVGGPSAAGQSAQPQPQAEQSQGMSTRTKIGLGAAALFGCYELGCFSHKTSPAPTR